MSHSVRFERPPVIELVLGVQFGPVVGLTSGHLGWFWKQYLGEEWAKATDAVPILDQFETFNEKRGWAIAGAAFQVGMGMPPHRLQLTTESGDRMIQVQPTRFHYNWQRKAEAYPSYPQVRKEFDRYFESFCRFVADAKLGDVNPNQWEITYVDHIPSGELWSTPKDWHKILPGLLGPGANLGGVALESLEGQWHYEIAPQLGRLHVSVQHGRLGEEATPGLLLTTTARGPISKEKGIDLNIGLNLGHDRIYQAFLELTSPEAQRTWKGVRL
jgi:uncharacterized protein (TIGR04255 family)